ncbi:RidA family protein, partial [candidate division KSB1 bacterium]|nr:RidA family protein [candidate division KSB1 bacterium]
RAPQAIGPYNQAVVANGFIFTAGQLGLDPDSGALVSGGIQEQTRRALQNVRAVLQAAGSDLTMVVKTTVFLADMNDFSQMNSVYSEFFTSEQPARSAVQVARLPKDALVEVEAVALLTTDTP